MRLLSAVISIQDGYSPPSLTHSSLEHPNLRTLKERLWVLNLLDCEHEDREREKREGPAVGMGRFPVVGLGSEMCPFLLLRK